MQHTYRSWAFAIGFFCLCLWTFNPGCIRGSCAATAIKALTWAEQADGDVLNATLGFQKIFVINLPTRSDRRDAMVLSGSLTNLAFEWVNGVGGEQVLDKVLPADSIHKPISNGSKGSWRAHMNTLQTILHQNLTTALILEDDIDWDIRLKSQLQTISLTTTTYLDILSSQLSHQTIISHPSVPTFQLGQTSPYGSNWDILWLGHCGTDFPAASSHLPLHRIQFPDDTVPSPEYLRPHPLANTDDIFNVQHPPHHRVVHAAGAGTVCTQAYAVSRRGAARLLWKFGLETFTTGWDLMLRNWCGGLYELDVVGSDRPVCVTVQPPVFVQHYGKGGASDITAPGGGFINRGKEFSPYVRKSVRVNMGALLRGEGVEGCRDQFPDVVEEGHGIDGMQKL